MKLILHTFIVIKVLSFLMATISSYLILSHKESINRELDPTNYFEPGQPINITRRSLAVKEREFLWDDGIIPYEIRDIFNGTQRKLLKRAMRHWEQSTCIKFVERIKEARGSYILFTKLDCGCCSLVGKRGKGRQRISIADGCDKFGTVVHELGHAIGFYHEHNRPDRDDYVKINYDRMEDGYDIEFSKLPAENISTLGQNYDYGSIMHYKSSSFATSPNTDTIIPLRKINQRIPKIGQRNGLSKGDIDATNLLYDCPKCGQTLFEPKNAFRLSTNADESQIDFEYCQWTIRAARGEKIKLDITSLYSHDTPNCIVDYLEIRNGYQNRSTVLGRYCGEIESVSLIADDYVTVTFIGVRYGSYRLGFSIKYETVCGGHVYLKSNDTHYLESPNYPESYGRNKQCFWNFIAPEDHKISVVFDYFDLEDSKNCTNDFFEIRDGDYFDAPFIGIYCGNKENLKISSPGGKIFLIFVSNKSKEAGGFSATISAQPN